jgi:hypothetical protein
MKSVRTITIGYTEYLLPEDITAKSIADIAAIFLALRPVESRARDIAGKWTSAEYLGQMRVALGARSTENVPFETEAQAVRHLDYLEQQAAQPETVGDPF